MQVDSEAVTLAATAAYPSPHDVSQTLPVDSLYVRSETRFPDGGGRVAFLKATCKDVVCGEAPWCVSMCGNTDPIKSKARAPLSDEEKLAASVKRSQGQVRDLVRASGLRYLLTLTAGKSLGSRAAALDAWSSFLNDPQYGRWFNRFLSGSYVAVAEPFSDGVGWHIHAAIPGYVPPAILARLKVRWTLYLDKRLGIARPRSASGLWRVEVKAPPARSSARSLGRYLAKYLSKSLEDSVLGERRFRAGQGCRRPTRARALVRMRDAAVWDALAALGHVREIRLPDGTLIGWGVEIDPRKGRPPCLSY